MKTISSIDFKCALNNHESYWNGHAEKDLSDYEIVKVSLEKQIPREFISEDTYNYTKFLCPTCEARVGDNEDGEIAGYNYCPMCGQRIKWD